MKKIITAAAALTMAVTLAGCGSKSSSSSGSTDNTPADMYISREAFSKDYADVEDAEKGPLLTIESVTAKPGDVAKVAVCVDTPDKNWSACGLHIAYSDALKCELADDDQSIKCVIGEACGTNPLTSSMGWQNELPEDIAAAGRNLFFFAAVLGESDGTSGKIATFYFKVPEDAESGTVYDLDYYYYSTDLSKDMFAAADGEASYEKYAFSHCTGGTITVE